MEKGLSRKVYPHRLRGPRWVTMVSLWCLYATLDFAYSILEWIIVKLSLCSIKEKKAPDCSRRPLNYINFTDKKVAAAWNHCYLCIFCIKLSFPLPSFKVQGLFGMSVNKYQQYTFWLKFCSPFFKIFIDCSKMALIRINTKEKPYMTNSQFLHICEG